MKKPAGILLAAGGSSRLGSPKQLLRIGDEYLINRIILAIRASGIDHVLVVLGKDLDEIQGKITDSQVVILENKSWQAGIGSSVQCGVRALEESVEAAIFFVVDQPYLNAAIIHDFLAYFEQKKPALLATRVGGQICHPTLFTRPYFSKLLKLNPDEGGKGLFKEFGGEYFDWDDRKLLLDIDTPHDLSALNHFDHFPSS